MHVYAFLLLAASISVAIWFYLWLARGQFWKVDLFQSQPAEIKSQVAVVIPARNEAESIAQTITSLLQQSYVDRIHIFLVDDESSDATGDLALAAARTAKKAASLTVIQGSPLPAGWTGKLWAMQQGVEAAMKLNPEFLLFTDADISHACDSIATLAAIAGSGNYDLVSFMVKLHCQTIAEKLLIPAFVFFFFKLYPPRWIADPKKSTAGAAGGCMLIRPVALQRAGGIAAIRDRIIDDCALARAIKKNGGRVWLGLTPSTHSTRRYETFGEIGRMISRTAFNQLNHSALLLFGSLLGLLVTYLLPPALLLASPLLLPAALGAAAWMLMALLYLPLVRFYGLNRMWALALPCAALFYMGATFHSALKFWLRRGGEWKGRVQDPTPTH